ncbi:MAG: dienelactone hydrolase family protein, partial [Chloroflexi bacterium]|nr:dienelactone hydrolase family protein [Chloroflexota bacterium]
CAAPTPAPGSTPSPTTQPTASPAPAAGMPVGYVDPGAVNSSEVTFTSEGFTIKAYLSRPQTGGTLPGLIIIHENRGLTDHIRDVARRYANQGYVVVAPDLLFRVGGTAQFTTQNDAVAAIGKLSSEGVMQDINAAFNHLQTVPNVNKDRIGVLGYCWGGGNSLLFATRNPRLKAAVVYYGPNPANIDDVARIAAPVLGIYGAEDTRITMNVPALEAAMKKYDKSFEQKTYPGAAHAFFSDTGARYNKEASADAWQTTIAFLQKNLKG